MGACGSKQSAEELHFSSLEHAADGDGKSKAAASDAVLPASSGRYAVSGGGGAGGGGSDGAVVPLQTAKALDPKDFQLSRRSNEVIVKYPGSLCGQSFLIEDCTDCDIFLLDHTAAVTIDVCINCRVFVGPCESSVFIRDSRDCSFVVAAQQLRLRDCHRLSLLLFVSASQPVIEASDDLRLSSFAFAYPQLAAQFDAAHLHPFNSQWANVHDFHQKEGGGGEEPHWAFLPFGTTAGDVGLRSVEEVTEGRVAASSTPDGSTEQVVPSTWGERPFARCQSALLLLSDGEGQRGRSRGYEAIRHVRGRDGGGAVRLLRSRCVRLGEERAQRLLGRSGAGKEAVIGLEWNGPEALRLLREAVAERGWSAEEAVVVEEGRSEEAIDAVFEAAAQV